MANIVTLNGPKPVDYLSNFVNQFVQDRAAKQQADAQDAQFQQNYDLTKQRTDSEVGRNNAEVQNMTDTRNDAQDRATFEHWYEHVYKPLATSGNPADNAEAIAHVREFMTVNPAAGKYASGLAFPRSMTDAEKAHANTENYAATQTGVAAAGSPDVQARAFTQENALGRPMSKQQFDDQSQRQPQAAAPPQGQTGDAYNQFLRRDAGALTTAAQDQTAATQKTLEGMRQSGENSRTQMQIASQEKRAAAEADPELVARYVTAAKGAAANGLDPSVVTNQIKDKRLHDAVTGELARPENGGLSANVKLTTSGQKQLTELAPISTQVDAILKKLEPLKDDNVSGLRLASLGYKAGFAPGDANELAGELGQLNLAQIQTIMPFATKSRNYQYIKDIKRHTIDPSKDTFKNMYQKLSAIKQNFDNMHHDILTYERVGSTGQSSQTPAASDSGNPLGLTPPGQ